MEEETAVKMQKSKNASTPPLIAAATRLERLLGGGLQSKNRSVHTYTNPAKVVRRWLGTASGAAGSATPHEIAQAAVVLLDSSEVCSNGRSLLSAGFSGDGLAATDEKKIYLTTASCREIESWLINLLVRCLRKEGRISEAYELSEKGIETIVKHLTVATPGLPSSGASNTSLFPLLACIGDMAKAHNMACVRRDVDCQATLLNLMLEDLIVHSQIEQAQKLLSNSAFPESASNNQMCRYMFYSGRIQALRLEYTKAFSNLSQCLRKAPTNTGLGFRTAAQRYLVVVQLLMGEIPDRHVFFTKGMQTELAPYLAITQAVRRGDLVVFNSVVSEQASLLQKDSTYTLISRLAHQVVKAGLRKLHMSYSRLSLQDVADRLGLPSAKSAEFVVAKAVRDGVLDATIHHIEGYVQSHDLIDVYATKEPTEAFHRRIAYCLTTHNDAVRGMRYPPDAYKKQLEASRGNRRKRNDDKTDEEKAQEIEDELEEDY
ncbi:MAG: hypothetical protein SGBAC_007763 [Bacillariaceae sp.]